MSPTYRARKRISLYRSNRPPIPIPRSVQDDTKRIIKTDYLKERRHKRELMMQQEKNKEWLVHLTNKKLSKKEKFYKIKEKAREIEEMALRKE